MSTGKIRAAGNWIDAGSGCVATRQKKKKIQCNIRLLYGIPHLFILYNITPTSTRTEGGIVMRELLYTFQPISHVLFISSASSLQENLHPKHSQAVPRKKTIREKKNGGKRGVLRCAVYKRNFHVFTPGSSSFFFQISGWSSKKRGQDSSLSILFGRRKKKGTARKVLLVWRHRQSSDDKSLNSHRCSTNTERENPCVCVWLRDADLRVA